MTQSITATLPDLGTFEGFNFRDQCAIERTLTADEVSTGTTTRTERPSSGRPAKTRL